MNKTLPILAALASLAVAAPAFSAEKETVKTETKVERDTNGDYEAKSSTEREDLNGTATSQETKVKVDRDDKGNVKKTVERSSKTDPKGLMNSTTEKTTDSVETKNGKTEYHHKHKVNGKTVEEKTTESDTTANQ